ncbi:MAG: flagellar export chaperone FlgN [SAR324 cluster bacterium]|nr:flagellar export chaperone FlgN [SAR324 cluster bacterium]
MTQLQKGNFVGDVCDEQSADMLLGNLAAQLELHRHLRLVLSKEIKLPANCEIKELEELQHRKIEIATKLFDIEIERQQLVQDIVKQLKLPPDEGQTITLKSLLPYLTGSLSKKLTGLQSELKDLIKEIQDLGHQTAIISRARLVSLRNTTVQLDKWMSNHIFYSKSGGLTNTAYSRVLSRHI